MTEYVKNWFRRADDDLILIEAIIKGDIFLPNPICFHAQQVAEKYLKGFLAYKDLHTRKIHDLEILVKDCQKIDNSFEEILESVKFLNQFYIETRYPGDYVEFSKKDAERSYQEALKIKDFIINKIK